MKLRKWIINRATLHLGAALASLVHLVDPELIILGGQIAEAGAQLLDPLREELRSRTRFLIGRDLPIVFPTRAVPHGSNRCCRLGATGNGRSAGLTWMYSPRRAPESIHFDVVVAGSGSAGATAAIAAARAGAKTLLVERFGFLGGTSTAVLDTFYGFYTPGSRSLKVVGGIADDVVKGLREHEACMERPNTYGAGTGITYNSEYLKMVWEQLVQDAGAAILLYAWIQDASVSGQKIQSLTVATKQGLRKVIGKYFVDATGDADLCYFAGAPCELAGEHEPAQMLTTTFKVANVDVALQKDPIEAGIPPAHGGSRRVRPVSICRAARAAITSPR